MSSSWPRALAPTHEEAKVVEEEEGSYILDDGDSCVMLMTERRFNRFIIFVAKKRKRFAAS
jgi:hypothetical protein